MRFTTARLALAALLLAPAALAQDAPRPHRRLEKLAGKLGLSEPQREQIRAGVERHADELQTRRAAVRSAREELRRVLDASPGDAAALRDAAQRVEAARSELVVARGARRAELRTALTPDQQQQAQQLRDAHRARKEERHEARQQRRAERRARKAAEPPR